MKAYTPPLILFNKHLETIYPSLLRNVEFRKPERERINTPDDDFLDLDWYRQGAEKCVIISHGLEGNSQRAYVRGMAKAFFERGYDVLTWNYRGCGEEINRQLRFYHSGATDDLQTVIQHAATRYPALYLVGFSLGGNITVKYMGEKQVHPAVRKAVAISAPLNLYTSCLVISQPSNWIYNRRFLKSLSKKVLSKSAIRNDLSATKLNEIKSLKEFDDIYTGPIHGFKDAMDYYTQCSGLHFIEFIDRPTLIMSAKNDPFLSPDCFPSEKFKGHPHVEFDFPAHGGHVGFALFREKGLYWSEMRALAFIQE